ncbi:transmembrane protein 65-like [Scaptodrosophila lebanonensis]|uniref:Transmembrane protein 65-like n=1 Tax=Drosophila lebanonensis TaxID=7225 RepID=A0A6J2TQE6_DROLE|nr:transmembrane protein 65-like [Scaptodrosophila lebanonensis]
MRHQCQGAFKHLMRHWPQQHSKQLNLFCRHQAQNHAATLIPKHLPFLARGNRQDLLLSPKFLQMRISKPYSKFSSYLSTERAMELICNLDEEERINLREAMTTLEAASKRPEANTVEEPTAGDLWTIFFVNAVPFFVFGFLDNFIMIIAGEYIEMRLNTIMTVSTMAAAGLGNAVSDLLSIATASYVENLCLMLGLKPPKLTAAQFELKTSKRVMSWGRILGITLGCLLGITPLCFV